MADRKVGEITVPTEPVSRATKITGFTFKSYDKNAGVLQFNIENQDGSPTDLIDATVRLFMYIYQGEEKKEFPIFDNQIITESYMQGIVKYPIPDMLLSYEGKVDANVYIDFPDGSHTDNLAFTFNIEKSVIDDNVQLNGEYYFKDFQQLLDGVKQEATDAVNEVLAKVDSSTAKMQELEQRIDEQTEIFNNADVYNKAEIEDKLEPFALRTDIDTLETKKADKTVVNQLEISKADKTDLANSNQKIDELAANKVDKGGAGQVTWGMIAQDVREQISGDKVAIVGKDSVSGIANIIDGSVPLADLSNDLKNNLAEFVDQDLEVKTGFLTYASTNVNTLNVNSLYKTVVSECEPGQVWSCDTKVDTSGTSAVIFWKADGTFLSDLERATGKTYNNFQFSIPDSCGYVSTTSMSSGVVPALRLMTLKNIPNMEAEIKNVKDRLLIYVTQDLEVKTGFLTYASTNVNTINVNPLYKTVVSECEPGQVWSLDTTVDATALSACIFWQEDGTFLTDLDRGANQTLLDYRVSVPENAYYISVTSLASGVIPVLRLVASGNIDSLDKRIVNLESEMANTFKDKVIVNFGDSIYGNTPAPNDISTVIASKLGATVHNLGFGGCMMAKRAEGTVNGEEQSQYDAFGMHALSYSIANADWTAQEAALGAGNTLPAYFRPAYNRAKSIDFEKVDIVTIEYGTNDWTHIAGSYQINLDNPNDPYDLTTYKGALRYSVENLYQINPKIQIVLTSPTYRFWLNSDGTFLEDSDTKIIRNRKLTDFVQAMREVAIEYKLPFLDNYHELGFNKYSRTQFFSGTDGTHPVPAGNIVIGSKIANFIKSNCW
ncbi:TPA: BppU family phage baseplate upper protein [Enterococcus faecium]